MWDVKLVDEDKAEAKAKFYLNYVGCKGLYFIRRCRKMASFTLTMWDVKTFQTSSYPSKSLCFTLTMWDVKKIVYTFHC